MPNVSQNYLRPRLARGLGILLLAASAALGGCGVANPEWWIFNGVADFGPGLFGDANQNSGDQSVANQNSSDQSSPARPPSPTYRRAGIGGSITGKVVDSNGQGVGGAVVRLMQMPAGMEGGRHHHGSQLRPGQTCWTRVGVTKTAGDGTFTVTNAPAGKYLIVAYSRNSGQVLFVSR